MDYPKIRTPLPKELKQIHPGVFWLRMPLKGSLDHINLYLLEDEDGWYLIDTGINSQEVREIWRTLLPKIQHDKPLKGIIITHAHMDHIGQAQWLVNETKCDFLIGREEFYYAHQNYKPIATKWKWVEFFKRAGVTSASVEADIQSWDKVLNEIDVPGFFTRIQNHQEINISGKSWKFMLGRGHALEHMCLYCESQNLLISGDFILPTITPHIGVWPTQADANPLLEFFETMPKFKTLPAETLVLPAHGQPFTGLSERCDYLIEHHQQQLDIILSHCQQPVSTLDLMKKLFSRPLDNPLIFNLALTETIAHINYLLKNKQVSRQLAGDGINYYTAKE